LALSVIPIYNSAVKDTEKRKILCGPKGEGDGCEKSDGSVWPPTILFLANFVAGIGGSLYYTLGVSYMDDNIQKAKTPALISEYRPIVYCLMLVCRLTDEVTVTHANSQK
jgi:hypothetical protein